MGICEKLMLPKVISLIQKFESDQVRMIELGNQHFNDGRVSKTFFKSMNVDHTSIDLNGLDESLPLNLCEDIILDQADIITNFGTSEHVDDQRMVFKNIHNLCKTKGYIINVVPIVGTWPNHCNYYYTNTFFDELAKINSYDILENTTLNEGRYVGSENLICCIFRKTLNSEFNWTEVGITKV